MKKIVLVLTSLLLSSSVYALPVTPNFQQGPQVVTIDIPEADGPAELVVVKGVAKVYHSGCGSRTVSLATLYSESADLYVVGSPIEVPTALGGDFGNLITCMAFVTTTYEFEIPVWKKTNSIQIELPSQFLVTNSAVEAEVRTFPLH